MKILSLCDGISCGQVALNRAEIDVSHYYASEIDKYAISVTQHHFKHTQQLGDMTQLSAKDLAKLGDLNIIMGGTPCQSFSQAGNGLGFDGESGLFWDFVRIVKTVQPEYFFLENVVMKKEWLDVISSALGVQPVLVNSGLVSAQSRERMYWTNMPHPVIQDKNINFKDIAENGEFELRGMELRGDFKRSKNGLIHCGTAVDIRGNESIKRVYSQEGKAPTLTTSMGGHREPKFMVDEKHYRKGTALEAERMQTLPDNYTTMLSKTRRFQTVGNGWTVDVPAEFFKGLVKKMEVAA